MKKALWDLMWDSKPDPEIMKEMLGDNRRMEIEYFTPNIQGFSEKYIKSLNLPYRVWTHDSYSWYIRLTIDGVVINMNLGENSKDLRTLDYMNGIKKKYVSEIEFKAEGLEDEYPALKNSYYSEETTQDQRAWWPTSSFIVCKSPGRVPRRDELIERLHILAACYKKRLEYYNERWPKGDSHA